MRTSLLSRPRVAKIAATAAAVGLSLIPVVAMAATVDVGWGAVGTSTGLSTKDVREVVARIINVAMGLLGIVAVVVIIIGGFYWMTAGGAEEKVETAKKYIFSGIIGLAIILTSYAIARFVVNSLVTATSEQ